MKILNCSDIHGDLELLENFRDYSLTRDDLDVIVVSGDLINHCWSSQEDFDKFKESREVLRKIREVNKINAPLYGLAKHILDNEMALDLRAVSTDYLESLKSGDETMRVQYDQIKEIFDTFNGKVFTIPGNYDGVCLDEIMTEENLHKKPIEHDGAKFAGYGGADVIPGHMPEDLIVDYVEYNTPEGTVSEPFNFLTGEDPDVAIIHNPPYGCCDEVGPGKSRIGEDLKEPIHVGSKGTFKYVENENPNLVLCGHRHGLEIAKLGDTVVVNPGNLGRVGEDRFGTFAEVTLDGNNYVEDLSLYQVVKPGVVGKIGKYVVIEETFEKVE